MFKWITVIAFSTVACSWASPGKVLKMTEGHDAYLVRRNSKILLTPKTKIEFKDEIFTKNSSVVIQVFKAGEVTLLQNTHLAVTKDFPLSLRKGVLRVKALESLKVDADGVSFKGNDAEFDVIKEGIQNIDLDVFKGSIEVSSPHVHTFVPEIVKANEAFRFDSINKTFSRREFKKRQKN